MTGQDIIEYNQGLAAAERELADALVALFASKLPNEEAKVWHGHPVWFVDGNPVCGYSLKKAGLEVLFWSGKSFKTSGLRPVGKYQAAGIAVETQEDLNKVEAFMAEATKIQWDYKNLSKLRKLEKLTDF
ncbi:MAG: hypothetical protein RIS66_231 [Actinomycetota bacterium]|jgi:hypothetical protein